LWLLRWDGGVARDELGHDTTERLNTCKLVSILSPLNRSINVLTDRGVTSRRRVSVTLPARTPPWMEAIGQPHLDASELLPSLDGNVGECTEEFWKGPATVGWDMHDYGRDSVVRPYHTLVPLGRPSETQTGRPSARLAISPP
jgi:hypothetical protein